MARMRAILVKDGKGPADNLYIGEAERPSPGAGQVLVKVRSYTLFSVRRARNVLNELLR